MEKGSGEGRREGGGFYVVARIVEARENKRCSRYRDREGERDKRKAPGVH